VGWDLPGRRIGLVHKQVGKRFFIIFDQLPPLKENDIITTTNVFVQQ
jgi:hypothetical protein